MENLDISNIPLMSMGVKVNHVVARGVATQLNGLFSLVDLHSIAHLAKLSLKRAPRVVMNQF
jgi:hypothetical protein